MSGEASLNRYEAALAAIDTEHAQKIESLLEQIRKDRRLPLFDRHVLGTTGSRNILKTWKALADRIDSSIGRPFMVQDLTESGVSFRLGLIKAPSVTHLKEPFTADAVSGVTLEMLAQPIVERNLDNAVRVRQAGVITVASCMRPDWLVDRRVANLETYADLTIGLSEIYQHPNFQHGISEQLMGLHAYMNLPF